jgi:hypothetical protein
MLLQSRAALITGATQGASVVLADIDADRAAESAAQLRSDGLTAATVVEVTGGRHA